MYDKNFKNRFRFSRKNTLTAHSKKMGNGVELLNLKFPFPLFLEKFRQIALTI